MIYVYLFISFFIINFVIWMRHFCFIKLINKNAKNKEKYFDDKFVLITHIVATLLMLIFFILFKYYPYIVIPWLL